jgi:hypothetical protein
MDQVIVTRKIPIENFDDPIELPEFYAEAVDGYQVFLHHATNTPCLYIDHSEASEQHILFLDWLVIGLSDKVTAVPVHHLSTTDREYESCCVSVRSGDLGEFLYCFARKKE